MDAPQSPSVPCGKPDRAAHAGGDECVLEDAAWYAVHTKPRHEKLVAKRLEAKGFEVFLPLIRRLRSCRGRRVEAQIPLFSCYLFVRSEGHGLRDAGWTRGVIRILGMDVGRCASVPVREIERIKTALQSDLKLDPHPYLKEGHLVRVRRGPLVGIEGILIRKDRHHRLIISVDLIAKSAAITINADDVEPI